MPRQSNHSVPHSDLPPVHPGEVLREDVLPALATSAADLARTLGIPVATVRAILAEKKPVTPEIAIRLAKAFKPSAQLWLRLQVTYDLWHAGRRVDTSRIPALQAAE